MCGRFSLHLTDLSEVAAQFSVIESALEGWQPRFNIAPSQGVPVVIGSDTRRIVPMQWGLVSQWSASHRSPRTKALINARAETAASLPSFCEALRARRCVVPATGYYEWLRHSLGKALPFWLALDNEALLAFAGLWQPPTQPVTGHVGTFAILTTQAAGPAATVHTRMPVMLSEAQLNAWLSEPVANSTRLLGDLTRDVRIAQRLVVRAVSTAVNSASFDGPECLAPAAPAVPERQLKLFDAG